MVSEVRPPRGARVGDRLPSSAVARTTLRRRDAMALLLPGTGPTAAYTTDLDVRRSDFAAWDGVVRIASPDGEPDHRLLVVDRYRQVYAVHDAHDAVELPNADALEEWFRFLATACPECGVIDDPLLAGPTP